MSEYEVFEPKPSDPNSDNLAIASLVLGIIGVISAFFTSSIVGGIIGFVASVLAIILGSNSRKKCAQDKQGMATAGLVLGCVGIFFVLVGVLCLACLCAAASSSAWTFYR